MRTPQLMRRTRGRLMVLGMAVVVIGGLWLLLILNRKPPVKHQGKTVREWVLLIDNTGGNERQRHKASSAIVAIGQPAVPELEEILAWRPHKWHVKLRPYLMRFHLNPSEEMRSQELVNRACEAAYNLGEDSKTDIGPLVAHIEYHLTNGTYADSANSRALASAGPRRIEILTNLIFSGSYRLRDQAGWALHFASERPEVTEALIRAVRTETNALLRANALGYLRSSRAPELLLPLAFEFLRSTNAYDRQQAKWALSEHKNIAEVRAALAESEP